MIYPTEWKIQEHTKYEPKYYKKNGTELAALARFSNEKGEAKTVYFYFSKYGGKENATKEAEKYEKSNKTLFNNVKNRYRYISENEIEVELTQGKTFITNAEYLEDVKKYCLRADLDNRYGDKWYVVYQLGQGISYQFTNLILNCKNVKYLDGNTLNLRRSNLLKDGEVQVKAIVLNNKKYDTTLNQYEIYKSYTQLLTLGNWKIISTVLPNNVWILGLPPGTTFKRTGENILTARTANITDDEELNKKILSKTFNISSFVSEIHASIEAFTWLYNVCYKNNLTKNLIRILNDNYIEVKLTKNCSMITDIEFLPLIQLIPLYVNKSGTSTKSKFYCYALREQVAYYNLITGYSMTDHVNHNPLDNRLINLQWTNYTENNRNRETNDKDVGVRESDRKVANLSSYEARGKYYGTYYPKYFYFKNEDEKKQAYNDAIIFRKNFLEINVHNSELEFTGKEYNEDFIFLLNYINLTKENMMNDLQTDINNYFKVIDELGNSYKKMFSEKLQKNTNCEEIQNISNKISDVFKQKMFNKYLTIQLWRLKNLDIKINIIKNQMLTPNIRQKVVVDNKPCFDTTYEVLTYDQCSNFLVYDHTKPEMQIKKDAITKSDIKNVQNIAKLKGGELLTQKIQSEFDTLYFECKNGHEFCLTYTQFIKDFVWCSDCGLSSGELEIKKVCKDLFIEKFNKIRPNWLKTNKGTSLEIDLFCEELKLAFEYNGKQHYEFVPMFHSTEENFKQTKEHDKIKLRDCTKQGITLIVIPYTVKTKNIKQFVIDQLKLVNIKPTNPNYMPEPESDDEDEYLVKKPKQQNLDFKKNKGEEDEEDEKLVKKKKLVKTKNDQLIEALDKIKQIIKDKEGLFIGCEYESRESIVTVKCKDGHEWTPRAKYLSRGRWCPTCARKISPEKAANIAAGMKKLNATKEGKEIKKKAIEKMVETKKNNKE